MLWYMSKWHFLLVTYNEKYYYEQLLFPQNILEIQNTLHKHPPVLSLKKGRTTQQWSKLQLNFQPVVKWKICKTTHWKYARKKYGLFLSMNTRQLSMHLIQVYFDRYSIIPYLCKFYSMIFQTSKRYLIIFCFILLSMTFYKVNIKIFFSYIVIETWCKYTAQ